MPTIIWDGTLAEGSGYRIDTIDPGEVDNIFKAIGAVNGDLDPKFVLNELRLEVQNRVFKEYRMSKDFRVAMSHFCQGEGIGQPLIDWLTGNNARVSSVKPFSIYTGINRTTARHFIQSALFWFRHVGYAGTVILLDNSRVTLRHNPRDGP